MIIVYYLKTIDENLKCCFGGVETKEPMSENIFFWFLGQFYITYPKIKKFHLHNSEIWFFESLMSYIPLPECMWWGRMVLHAHHEVPCALITCILVVEFMTSKFQKIIFRNCVNETFLFLDMLCKIVQGIRKKCFET